MEKKARIVENNFTYHPPKGDQQQKYETIRNTAKDIAYMFLNLCPASRERDLAFTKLEESIMWANASIARNE